MTKKNTLLLFLAAGTGCLALTSYSSGPGNGGLGDLSDTGCGASGCHATNNASTALVSLSMVDLNSSTTTPSGQYIPGHSYVATLVASNNTTGSTFSHFGFQTTARRSNGNDAGTLSPLSFSPVQTYTANGHAGVEHTAPIPEVSTGNFYQVSFQWTAPAAGTGPVTFFSAINLVNNDAAPSGDQPNVVSTTLSESSLSVRDIPEASTLLTIHPNPAKDRIRIAAKAWPLGKYDITILNAAGSVVLQQGIGHSGTTEFFDVVLPNLATGLYGIRVKGEGVARSAPLFIR